MKTSPPTDSNTYLDRVELSFCIVNTNQCELLKQGLDAVARERNTLPFNTEVLVLDNASQDNSVEIADDHPTVDILVHRERRFGKSENDSLLLKRARGRYCLLLNEDSELLPGATEELYRAISQLPDAAAVGGTLLRPDLTPQPSAWRFPSPLTALFQALLLHNRLVVQSKGLTIRRVDWVQSAAMIVNREAAQAINYLDPEFFVYSDEVDFCKRLRVGGWNIYFAPMAKTIHHEQLSTGSVPHRRIIEMARNRDLYIRKHHSISAAFVVRLLTAIPYALRAVVAIIHPNHNSKRYLKHVGATLFPKRGKGLRESAAEFNSKLNKSENSNFTSNARNMV